MEMEIVPFESVGELRFGETRDSIRRRLGARYRAFKKDVGANDTDAYDDLGLHLYFDDGDQLEFVEAFGEASLSLSGVTLLGRRADDVASDLSALGYESLTDDVGLQCDSAGLGFITRGGIIDGVAVFRRGYYATR